MLVKTRKSGINNKPYEVAEDIFLFLSNGDKIFIHEGYATDYASIPSVLKLFLEWKGEEADAYIIHDYLYNYSGYRQEKWADIIKVKRKWADKEMYLQMSFRNSPKWRKFLYYISVRFFGFRAFGNI